MCKGNVSVPPGHRREVMVSNTRMCSKCRTANDLFAQNCANCGYQLAGGPVDHTMITSSNQAMVISPTTNPASWAGLASRRITGALPPGYVLEGRYHVVDVIGKGGFGAVYKATDERFQSKRIVAIKEMSDAHLSPSEKTRALRDFRNEANLLVQLKHPNLPDVSDFFEEGGKAYLVIEFIEGKTLEVIQNERQGPLDERLVMGWALQLCDVLHYLHTRPQPIIFRDMKPTNVMVTADGKIKLIDFGIARIFKTARKKDTTLLGSHGYAPLEQYGQGQSDPRSDIYALGATLYDLLTKHVPVDAPVRQVNPTIFSPPRQLNPKISPVVEAIILKAMAKEPSNRYQTAVDIYQAVAATGLVNISPSMALVSISSSLSTSFPPRQISHSQLSRQRRPLRNGKRLALVVGPLILLLLFVSLSPMLYSKVTSLLHPDPIKVWTTSNGELIGLSDGRWAFDTGQDRGDATLKKQAGEKLAQGNKMEAQRLWSQAARSDTSDAEALIYLENQRILASGSLYITLVVGTMLTGNDVNISNGRNHLQGAYVAQKEYNDGRKLNGGRLVRLLIANAGSKPENVTPVAQQIVQAAQQDVTIVGVMGWSYSAYAHKAIDIFTSAYIPMVSSTASADDLSGISPYFFRVAPTNKSQAIAGARYAEQQLHASRVALFVDPKDSYSNSLAKDFQEQFVANGNQIVAIENYTVKDKASLPTHLQNALSASPDLIYFAGYADDLEVLLVNLGTSQPKLQVLGGDALYSPRGYSPSARVGFSRLHFTTFAFFDEWKAQGLESKQPQFFSDYPAYFNPNHEDHSRNPYSFIRADYRVMLSYDATYVLLQGCQNILSSNMAIAPKNLREGILQITGENAIQGVSGQISFGSNGDPMNKAVIILYIDQDGYTQMLQPNGRQGCFTVGLCGE
jgi:serine/threonine protein kinase/ABC-type branched-subunit amino acid transport system substrate-binding protein